MSLQLQLSSWEFSAFPFTPETSALTEESPSSRRRYSSHRWSCVRLAAGRIVMARIHRIPIEAQRIDVRRDVVVGGLIRVQRITAGAGNVSIRGYRSWKSCSRGCLRHWPARFRRRTRPICHGSDRQGHQPNASAAIEVRNFSCMIAAHSAGQSPPEDLAWCGRAVPELGQPALSVTGRTASQPLALV
jgi:hypothetical protein